MNNKKSAVGLPQNKKVLLSKKFYLAKATDLREEEICS